MMEPAMATFTATSVRHLELFEDIPKRSIHDVTHTKLPTMETTDSIWWTASKAGKQTVLYVPSFSDENGSIIVTF